MENCVMKPTILIVDDEDSIRELLRETLARDYNVIEASEGAEGLSKLIEGKQKIDLIITDLRMPGLDGIEFIESFPEDIPFIIISGFLHLMKFREPLKEFHPAAVFEKPFRIPALLQAVQRALEQ